MNTINTIILGLALMAFTCCNPHNEIVLNPQKTEISADASFDFDNYAANNWEIALTGKGKMCDWKIKDDNGNKVLAQVSSETNHYRFNLISNKDLSYQDVEISVRFKGITGDQDQGGGPVWRYIDENNYYVARANPLENNFRVYKVVDGDRRELESADVEMNSNQWYNLKITMKGDKIQCFFNDKLELETTDKTFPDAGKIGLWTKSDAVTYFDDLNVKIY